MKGADKIEKKNESVVTLSISELHPFVDHPFEVRDDDAMKEIADSVNDFGILTPIVVRPREEGGFEIISGHRRVHACELAGKTNIPAIIRECSRDQAIIMMVDSNLQRDVILPTEKAKAYKMKMDALKRQGARADLTSHQVGEKLGRANYSVSKVARDANESTTQVHRYIRLNSLVPELQHLVDEKKIGITPAVEISYLKPEEQDLLVTTIESEQATPSLSQAQKMRKMSGEGTLNEDTMLSMMMEPKKPEQQNVVLTPAKISRFFPRNYTAEQVERVIIKLLESWQKQREKKMQQAAAPPAQHPKKKSEHSL